MSEFNATSAQHRWHWGGVLGYNRHLDGLPKTRATSLESSLQDLFNYRLIDNVPWVHAHCSYWESRAQIRQADSNHSNRLWVPMNGATALCLSTEIETHSHKFIFEKLVGQFLWNFPRWSKLLAPTCFWPRRVCANTRHMQRHRIYVGIAKRAMRVHSHWVSLEQQS